MAPRSGAVSSWWLILGSSYLVNLKGFSSKPAIAEVREEKESRLTFHPKLDKWDEEFEDFESDLPQGDGKSTNLQIPIDVSSLQ